MKKDRSVPITEEVRVLKFMRIQAGFSLKKAARQFNMTDGAISHIENGLGSVFGFLLPTSK